MVMHFNQQKKGNTYLKNIIKKIIIFIVIFISLEL